MIQYPYIVLPDYFTLLLRVDHQKYFGSLSAFEEYVRGQADLDALCKRMFTDIDPQLRFEAIFKSLGWTGFRNRLCSGFVSRMITGHYPLKTDQDLVSDIIVLESVLKPSTPEGHNRAFLYGFYLKMCRLRQGTGSVDSKGGHQHLISKSVLECLKLQNSRVLRIDQLVILLEHFVQYLGEDECLDLLKQGLSFSEMMDKCTQKQQRELSGNLLNYGGSINETDFLSGAYVS